MRSTRSCWRKAASWCGIRNPAKILTLDGVERALELQMLVIADAAKPMAVAGVMGGEHSGINETTTDVLLESANFRPAAIRATSKKLGMLSDASYRFMRGVDAELAEFGSRRAAAKLMCELAGAQLLMGVVDVRSEPKQPWKVVCRPARLEALLGIAAAPAEIAQGLRGAGAEGAEDRPGRDRSGSAGVPRGLTREANLIEEYARIYGLKKLPPVRSMAAIVPDADDKPAQAQARLREVLVGLGLQQIMHYSFLAEGSLDLFDKDNAPNRVKLANPLTADHTVMGDALLPQMAETIGLNFSRQVAETAFFETGRGTRLGPDGKPTEEPVAIGLFGPAGRTGLDKFKPVGELEMFLWIKGLWEQAAAALNLRGAAPARGPAVERAGARHGNRRGRRGCRLAGPAEGGDREGMAHPRARGPAGSGS